MQFSGAELFYESLCLYLCIYVCMSVTLFWKPYILHIIHLTDILVKRLIRIAICISVKCIFLQIDDEIVENQDLYRKKDNFWIFLKQKVLILNFILSVSCRMKGFQKKSYLLTDKIDFQRSSAPKKKTILRNFEWFGILKLSCLHFSKRAPYREHSATYKITREPLFFLSLYTIPLYRSLERYSWSISYVFYIR